MEPRDRHCLLKGLGLLLIGCAAALLVDACMAAPVHLELVATIPLSGVKGRIDHLAADPDRHRLFVAALGNDTVEVIDTRGRTRHTIAGLGQPQGLLYVPGSDRLIIANGGAGRADIVDATSLQVVERIPGLDDADNVRWSPTDGIAIVGYGKGKGGLRLIDPASRQSRGDIRLPGHPESFQLDPVTQRIYVNVPSTHAVVVVDLATRRAVARWETPDASSNFPMALDVQGRRVFVAARSPAVLLVYDADSGNVLSRLPICGDADDVFFDDDRKHVYVVCGEGRVDVVREDGRNRFSVEQSVATAQGARTGLFVPAEGSLFVAAPAGSGLPARVLVYTVTSRTAPATPR
jgi:DNA-binding beta-propeller fold protein YncE